MLADRALEFDLDEVERNQSGKFRAERASIAVQQNEKRRSKNYFLGGWRRMPK
jgi:hypothetical protein